MMSEPVQPVTAPMPEWAAELVALYESNAINQFILHGNVNDRLILPLGAKAEMGTLTDFLLRVLLPRFDVILSYDLGNGIRVEKGGEIFTQWPHFKDAPELPKAPRQAIETLTQYFRYCANLAKLGRQAVHVGCIIKSTDLITPNLPGGLSYDLNAMAMLIRDWSVDSLLAQFTLATFLITENLNDLHPLLVQNTRAGHIKVPLPSPADLCQAFHLMSSRCPMALKDYRDNLSVPAEQLAGATLSAVETLLKTKEHGQQPITSDDLVKVKKELIEQDCNGLIEFIDSSKTLDDFQGQDKVKAWLRQDLALWQKNDLAAMPMGYLLCGPVGTGKTFLINCLAGEAGVPVVKINNFRDKWVGSTEGNLEKIFRLLHALGRCFVFIDEADQTLGKRDPGSGDSGLSGRIYSMIAAEMSDTQNRGKIIWTLASSRPDLIEVDLKRPGRVDVKIPLFPTLTAEESFNLIRILCKRRDVIVKEDALPALAPYMPLLLTPGAAEALAVKVYRVLRTNTTTPEDALRASLVDYQNPVPTEVMAFQIDLAIREASDLEFVPPALRPQSAKDPVAEVLSEARKAHRKAAKREPEELTAQA
ncbi:MAG: ATP-binding protein [Armatimonadota bacterium]